MVNVSMCVCLSNQTVRLLVDIQHNQCPCWFFLVERYKLCAHKTTLHQRQSIAMQYSQADCY